MRIQVVGRNGKEIFKGGVEVPEEVSRDNTLSVHFVNYNLECMLFISTLHVVFKQHRKIRRSTLQHNFLSVIKYEFGYCLRKWLSGLQF